MTHLKWLCELKRYLCYICRSQVKVRLGCIEWQESDCVGVHVAQVILHANYSRLTLANDIALLHLVNPVTFTSKYPSRVLTYVILCVVRPHVIDVQHYVFCTF